MQIVTPTPRPLLDGITSQRKTEDEQSEPGEKQHSRKGQPGRLLSRSATPCRAGFRLRSQSTLGSTG